MKILIINKHRDDELGGSELQCDFIAEELTIRRHEVIYLSPGGLHEQYDRAYDVITCGFSEYEICKSIRRLKPDIIYWRFNKNLFLPVVRWTYQQNIPFIFAASSVNDVDPWFLANSDKVRFTKKLKNLSKSLWHHLGYRYIDALTVNNKEHLHKLKVRPQFFIPNGMNSNFQTFDWDKPYCAWISNLKSIKRPEIYVKLAKEFEASGIDFIMVGKMMKKRYKWLADREKVPTNLHYLGFKTPEEINGILRSSLFHIHTCYPEGFPNVFIQAWSQKVPSVSFGYDPNDYLQTKNIGYHADENWQLFVSYVNKLIHDDELRAQMGENALKFSKEMFSIEKMVNKLEVLMDALVNKDSRQIQSYELL